MKLYFRWKLLILTLTIALVALGSYTILARNIFEQDKKAYVFDSSFSLAQQLKERLDLQLRNIKTQAKVLVYSYDFENAKASPSLETFFKEKKEWKLLSFWEVQDGNLKNIIWQNKNLPETAEAVVRKLGLKVLADNESILIENLQNHPGGEEHYLLLFRENSSDNRQFLTGLWIEKKELFSNVSGASELRMDILDIHGNQVAALAHRGPDFSTQKFVQELDLARNPEISTVYRVDQKAYLVSTTKLESGPYFVLSALPEEVALSSLQTLFRQSSMFLLLLVSLVVIATLFFSKFLSQGLESLTIATRKLADGDLDHRVRLSSKDELEELGEDFNKMSSQIKKLVAETADLARMESELKTAQAVQETLFAPAHCETEAYEISGSYVPASECGGDWWFYFEKNHRVYVIVADATGHGAPAALITSAARAAVALAQDFPSLDLPQLAQFINRAVFETSKGQILMTAFMLCFDYKKNIVEVLNASHEPPFLMDRQGTEELQFLDVPNNPRLGQEANFRAVTAELSLAAEQSLVLFTDGIPSVQNKSGKDLGERRFLKFFKESYGEQNALVEVISSLYEKLDDYREGSALRDDLTLVLFRKKI